MTVFEVMTRVMPKLSGQAVCTIFEAIGAVQDVIVNHLLMRRSELLLSEVDATVTFKAGVKRKYLPDEFLGLAGRPTLPDGTKLTPLDGVGVPGTETGQPLKYRVLGKILMVYPVPEEEVVISLPFYARPEAPTETDDELPFWGLFDSAFVDACVPVMSLGMAAVAEPGFAVTIQAQVDTLLKAQAMQDEQLLADSINGI